jgi:hypothetical protein
VLATPAALALGLFLFLFLQGSATVALTVKEIDLGSLLRVMRSCDEVEIGHTITGAAPLPASTRHMSESKQSDSEQANRKIRLTKTSLHTDAGGAEVRLTVLRELLGHLLRQPHTSRVEPVLARLALDHKPARSQPNATK